MSRRASGIELPRRRKTTRESDKDDLLEVVDEASQAFHQALGFPDNAARKYLDNRGVSDEIVKKYGFGYAPDSWDYILTRLARKYGEKKLELAGLVMPRKSGTGFYDRFRNRLMIPIHSETGALVGFGGRSLDGSDPKYLNSPSRSSSTNRGCSTTCIDRRTRCGASIARFLPRGISMSLRSIMRAFRAWSRRWALR